MHVTHAHSDISSSRGGIVAALASLLPALYTQNVDVDLVALQYSGEERSQSPLDSPFLHLAHTRGPRAFSYAPDLKSLLEEVSRDSDVIHSHGLWLYMSYTAYRVARETRKPHIIAIHGMLQPYMYQRSRWKKAPIEWWYQNRALERAAAIHVLVPSEIGDVRRLGFNNPVALVPNGVDLKSVDDLPSRTAFDARFPAAKDKKILLFMARLHPKKGLLHFLPAWKRALESSDARDWHFVVAGPDEGGHRAQLESLIVSLDLRDRVTFTGLLNGEAKREALGVASAFVLPSHSEGFSISLLEALGARLPLLITPNCNFPESVQAGAAISVESNEWGSFEGLNQLFALSDTQREEMGQRGRTLVEGNYTWDVVAKNLKAVYGWCAGDGEKPACIID